MWWLRTAVSKRLTCSLDSGRNSSAVVCGGMSPQLVGMFPCLGRRGLRRSTKAGTRSREEADMSGIAQATASSALERLPVSRWHWRLVVFVGLGTFFDL